MSLVRFSYWSQNSRGEPRATFQKIEFATRTPLIMFFFCGDLQGFVHLRRTVGLRGQLPFVRRAFLDHVDRDSVTWTDGVMLERELDEIIRRFFEPPEIDVDTPPGILADWLDDRKLHKAAAAVRKHETDLPTPSGE